MILSHFFQTGNSSLGMLRMLFCSIWHVSHVDWITTQWPAMLVHTEWAFKWKKKNNKKCEAEQNKERL